jgi:hypothetical protein
MVLCEHADEVAAFALGPVRTRHPRRNGLDFGSILAHIRAEADELLLLVTGEEVMDAQTPLPGAAIDTGRDHEAGPEIVLEIAAGAQQ